MDKIVSLTDRIENLEQKRQLKEYRSRIDAVKKITYCSSCRMKCSMCGQYLDISDSCGSCSTGHGHIFCKSCSSEFEDFISLSKGAKSNHALWHNEEWKRMWMTWLQYQQALKDFIKSPEFKLLLEEMDTQV